MIFIDIFFVPCHILQTHHIFFSICQIMLKQAMGLMNLNLEYFNIPQTQQFLPCNYNIIYNSTNLTSIHRCHLLYCPFSNFANCPNHRVIGIFFPLSWLRLHPASSALCLTLLNLVSLDLIFILWWLHGTEFS